VPISPEDENRRNAVSEGDIPLSGIWDRLENLSDVGYSASIGIGGLDGK
jgi:hypothetical protein